MALYGWARLVDQFGDDYAGDRMAALDEVERQLRLALGLVAHARVGVRGPVDEVSADEAPAGEPALGHPSGRPPVTTSTLVARMAETVRRLDLPTEPLFDLVQANRQDQPSPATRPSRTWSATAGCPPTRWGGWCSPSSG